MVISLSHYEEMVALLIKSPCGNRASAFKSCSRFEFGIFTSFLYIEYVIFMFKS